MLISSSKWSIESTKIKTDSRKIEPGDMYIALIGENFDGHDFIEDAFKAGASYCVSSIEYDLKNLILVNDTLKFLQDIATEHVKNWKKLNPENKIIGITGSNGKTTHKEFISALLKEIFPDNTVLATVGNLNNHIGVPLTVLQANEQHKILVIEMGMNHRGEIQILCDIAQPEHGIITNIGPAHIEFMGTMENIFLEKSTLYQAVLKNSKGHGIMVGCADDEYLKKLTPPSLGLSLYGENDGEMKIVVDDKDQSISFNDQNNNLKITNKNIREHYNLKNLFGAFYLILKIFPDKVKDLINASARVKMPSMNRSEWRENIFLDAYNANPSSMKTSIDSFVAHLKMHSIPLSDALFVLGDMNELGDHAEKFHKMIGEHLLKLGAENIVFIGRYHKYYSSGYTKPHKCFLKKEEFGDEWIAANKKYKSIFVKASRSLKLESLLNLV